MGSVWKEKREKKLKKKKKKKSTNLIRNIKENLKKIRLHPGSEKWTDEKGNK